MDGDVMFRQDKMLLLYIEMWGQIKLHQTMQVQKYRKDCTEFCKCKGLCEIWKDILKYSFWQKWATAIRKKKIVAVFLDFFLLYVYHVFTLVLFSYRSYFIQKLCRKENHKRSFFIINSNFFILCFAYEIETTT